MKKPYVPFLAFLVLLLLVIPFSFDLATSVVPGWHTTIFPPYFVWWLVTLIVLLLVVIGYWLLLKRVDKINWTLFAVHVLLTIPTVIFLKYPSILLNVDQADQNRMIKEVMLRMKLVPVVWIIFIVGQILFLIYFIRAIKGNRILK